MIFKLLLTVALVGAAVADDSSPVGGGLFGGRLQGVIEPRMMVNAIRIHDLEKQAEKLRKRIDEAKHVDPERFVNDLSARLEHIEGTHCDKKEFQCGSNGQECISDLFVCDGINDCHNGHDEDAAVCSKSAVKPGNVFTGMVHYTDCLTRDDHPVTVRITGTKVFKFFTSRVGVQAVVTSTYKGAHGEEKTRSFDMHGGYNFANHRLVLIPKHAYGKAHLGLKCEFGHGDNERADCQLLTEASLHECAQVHLALEHH
jgi:hypothetical protein